MSHHDNHDDFYETHEILEDHIAIAGYQIHFFALAITVGFGVLGLLLILTGRFWALAFVIVAIIIALVGMKPTPEFVAYLMDKVMTKLRR